MKVEKLKGYKIQEVKVNYLLGEKRISNAVQ